MKTIKLLVLSVALFYGYSAVNQTIVSTEVEKKNPVVFDFTGIHCVSCPHAHEAIAVAKDHYPQVVALAFHTGNFAVPNAGEPDFRTLAGDSLVDKFAYWMPADDMYRVVWAYPTVCINGTGVENDAITDTLQFLEKISNTVNEDAIANIGAVASIDTVKRKLKVKVECYYTSAATDSNYLVVSITQNGLTSTQAGVGDNYVHKDMFRMFVSNIWGDTLGIPQQGDFIEKTYYTGLPDSIKYYDSDAVELILQNIQVQAYITGNDTTVMAYDFIGIPYKNRKAFDVLNGVNATIEFVNLNGIFTKQKERLFSVFPNPAKDFVNIRLSNKISQEQNIVVNILNIKGRILITQTLSNPDGANTFKIPVKGLNKGIYFIRLNGKSLAGTSKFLIE